MKNRKVVLFAGGGTAGHIFPGLAVAEELMKKYSGKIAWIGSRSAKERKWVTKAGISFYGIHTGKWRRYLSLKNIVDMFRIVLGFIESLLLIQRLKPVVFFSKGGYVSVPPALACSFLKIPVFTHESDFNPGLATRINSRFGEKIFISFSETKDFFTPGSQKKVHFSGNPVRSIFYSASATLGKKSFNIQTDKPILLVIGGSLGSARINELILAILDNLTEKYFIIHQMGRKNYSKRNKKNYLALPFVYKELPHVIAAAELIISRAGANALFEYAFLGKPAILIPLSLKGSRGDQIRNARYYAHKGAALLLDENRLTPDILLDKINNLMSDKERLRNMSEKIKTLSKPDAAKSIARFILERVDAHSF
jgi:UDP-N-acetylglucosamine--N-acetylmuramyl-(pentapeptide) pyrophosphoryl-undecaprenol N-acetylglucosamine transferase